MVKIITNIFIILIIFYKFSLSQVFDDPKLNLYDAIDYKINLRINLSLKSTEGSINIKLLPITYLDEIVFSASNKTIEIDSIIDMNNLRLNFKHVADHIYIKLQNLTNDTLTLNFFYRAYSDFNGEFENGGIYFYQKDNSIKIATSSQPFFARKWIPCKDQPSDKVTSSMAITVPDTLMAISNGILTSTILNNDQTKTFFWQSNYPISTYLIFFAVGKYIQIEENYESIKGNNLKIQYFVESDYIDKAKADFSNTKKMLRFMEDYFCEYPFIKDKYGIVLVPGELIMENQTITSIKEDLITGNGDVEQILIHELAHHWFGNLVTPKSWHHLWLSEGFANYVQALYYEYYLGNKWYHYIINHYMDREYGAYAGSLIGKSDTSFSEIFSEKIYFKGAIVLHMLRNILGDKTFFQGLKRYVTNPNYKYSNVTTEDFIYIMEETSQQNLQWFFNQWVYSDADSIDRPVLKVSWEKQNVDEGYKVTVKISQLTGHIINYYLPLEIGIITQNDTTNFKVTITDIEQNFNFMLQEEPLNLLIDKDNWVFKKLIEDVYEKR